MLSRLFAFGLVALASTNACAQTPPQPSDAARALVGVWELSNPDRDRKCQLTFKLDAAGPGRALTARAAGATAVPDLRATPAWPLGVHDAPQTVPSKGEALPEVHGALSGR